MTNPQASKSVQNTAMRLGGGEYVGLETLRTIGGNLDTTFDLVFPIPAVILRSQLRVV